MCTLLLRTLALLAGFLLALPAHAENLPAAKPSTPDLHKTAWVERCSSEAKFSTESAIKHCQCIADKLGYENLGGLASIQKQHPDVVETCTTVGPKPWIRNCVKDSKMATGPATSYCQCIWDHIGPENVPSLETLKDAGSEALRSCKARPKKKTP